jgi:hypothetical protein
MTARSGPQALTMPVISPIARSPEPGQLDPAGPYACSRKLRRSLHRPDSRQQFSGSILIRQKRAVASPSYDLLPANPPKEEPIPSTNTSSCPVTPIAAPKLPPLHSQVDHSSKVSGLWFTATNGDTRLLLSLPRETSLTAEQLTETISHPVVD